jgi:hypothetical protein
MDENPWKEGFRAGRLGLSLDACPDYPEAEFWNWYCGYLSGRRKPLRVVGEKSTPSNVTIVLPHTKII